jgi:hypothetical protein
LPPGSREAARSRNRSVKDFPLSVISTYDIFRRIIGYNAFINRPRTDELPLYRIFLPD